MPITPHSHPPKEEREGERQFVLINIQIAKVLLPINTHTNSHSTPDFQFTSVLVFLPQITPYCRTKFTGASANEDLRSFSLRKLSNIPLAATTALISSAIVLVVCEVVKKVVTV